MPSNATQVNLSRTCINCKRPLSYQNRSGFCGRRECKNAYKRQKYASDKKRGVCTYNGCHDNITENSIALCYKHFIAQRKVPSSMRNCHNCGAVLSSYNKSGYCVKKQCRNAYARAQYQSYKDSKICTYPGCEDPPVEGTITLCSWHRDVYNANRRRTPFGTYTCRNCGAKLRYKTKRQMCSRKPCKNVAESERQRHIKIAKGICIAPFCRKPFAKDGVVFCQKHLNIHPATTNANALPSIVHK